MNRSHRSRGRAALIVLLVACALVIGALAALQLGDDSGSSTAVADQTALQPEGVVDVGQLEAGKVSGASAAEEQSSATQREALETALEASQSAPDGHAVYGRLLDESGTRPIADANLWLSGGEPQRSGRSDAEGRFRLTWPTIDEPQLEVDAFGYVLKRYASVPVDTELEVRLVLAASIEVVGVGAMPLGKPETENGAAIAYEMRRGAGARSDPLISSFDEQGRASFYNLQAGEYFISAQAPGTGIAFERVDLAMGESRVLSLDLPRAAALEGRVLETAREAGIAAVEVRVRPSLQGVWRDIEQLGERVATTDAAGRFSFEEVHPGPLVVELRTPWGAHEQRGLDLGGSSGETHHFRIDPPASLAGFVRDARGRPVDEALVQVSVGKRNGRAAELVDRGDVIGQGVRGQRTNAEGAFEFRNLPAGADLHLTATHRSDGGYRHGRFAEGLSTPFTVRLDAGELREGVELRLAPTDDLYGTVVDQSGDPVEEADVVLARLGSPGRWGQVTTSGAGEFLLGGLIEGTYVLFITHDDFAVVRERIDWVVGSDESLEFTLERLGQVEVVVVDEFGGALSNVLAIGRATGTWDNEPPGDRRDRTDDFGRAQLTRLEAGEWGIYARAKGYEPAGDPERVQISTGSADRVEVVLRSKPREERATVIGTVSTVEGGVPRRLRFSDRRGGSLSVEDGRFRLTGAKPGRTRLVLRAKDCVPHRTEAIQLLPGGEYDLGAIELQPASRLQVLVQDAEGKRLGGVSARLLALPTSSGGTGTKQRLSASVLSRGRLRFVDVPRYTWVLRVDLEGYRTHRENITVSKLQQGVTVVLKPD